MSLSDAQLKKLSKGGSIQLRHDQIVGSGIDIRKLSAETQKKLKKAWNSNKGMRLKLNSDEIEGSGLNFKKMAKSGAKMAKKGIKEVNEVLKDAGKDSIQEQLIKKHIIDPDLQSALIKKADEKLGGRGILGKKVDKLLKNAGVKKLAYKAGDALKPVIQEGINTASQMGSIMAPEFAPVISSSSAVANDYLDKPSAYQKKSGWKRGMKVGMMGGVQDAMLPTGSGFAKPASTGYGFSRPASMGGAVAKQPEELREVGLSSKTLLAPNHPALVHPFFRRNIWLLVRMDGRYR
jgi:hypothetical protein